MADIRYLTDRYDEKIKEILDFDAPLNFVFITDQHNRMNEYTTTWDKTKTKFELAANHIESIQYIIDRVPNITCVVSGGDIGNDYDPDPNKIRASHQEVMDALYKLSKPVHCVVGNHDDALGAATDRGRDNTKACIGPEEMHKLCMKFNPTDENYYYTDFDDLGYRFVFLNTSDKPYYLNEKGQYAVGWRLEISDKQAIWFEKEALDTDKKIIVFSHSPLSNKGVYGSEGGPIPGYDYVPYIKPYDDTYNAPRVYHAAKSCKNVVALIAGHVHYDNLFYDDDVLSITSLASLAQEWDELCPKREFGTITETAFDVISVKGTVMKLTRFGAGNDRIGRLIRG